MKITFDNGEEYTEEKFKKDKTRMFDFIRDKESKHFGECNCSDRFTIHLKKHNWLNKKVYHAIQDIVINMFRSNTDTELDLAYLLNGPVKRYYEYKLNHRKHKK